MVEVNSGAVEIAAAAEMGVVPIIIVKIKTTLKHNKIRLTRIKTTYQNPTNGVPGIRMGPPATPAGSTGFMARVLGFVLIAIVVLGGITRVQDPDTIETSSQELK